METDGTFDPQLIHAIFKVVWQRRTLEREKEKEPYERTETLETEEGAAGTSKRTRSTTANTNALKLSSELLRIFVTEAIQRAATIADAEGVTQIEGTHLERILPQFLLDF